MANPFENADGTYLVLINEEGQYSLWPGFIDVPSGWTVVHEQKGREACLDYIQSHWSDMRPNSLRLLKMCNRIKRDCGKQSLFYFTQTFGYDHNL